MFFSLLLLSGRFYLDGPITPVVMDLREELVLNDDIRLEKDEGKTKERRWLQKSGGCSYLSSFLLLLCISSSKLISDPINSSRLLTYNISAGRSHKNPEDENKKKWLVTYHSVSKSLKKSHFTSFISVSNISKILKKKDNVGWLWSDFENPHEFSHQKKGCKRKPTSKVKGAKGIKRKALRSFSIFFLCV